MFKINCYLCLIYIFRWSWSIPSTRLSVVIPRSTGCAALFRNTGSLEVLPTQVSFIIIYLVLVFGFSFVSGFWYRIQVFLLYGFNEFESCQVLRQFSHLSLIGDMAFVHDLSTFTTGLTTKDENLKTTLTIRSLIFVTIEHCDSWLND